MLNFSAKVRFFIETTKKKAENLQVISQLPSNPPKYK